MKQAGLMLKLEVCDIENELTRTIVLPTYYSLYDLHIVIATLFDFNDLATATFTIANKQLLIDDEQMDVAVFQTLAEHLDLTKGISQYTYHGASLWRVQISGKTTTITDKQITCTATTGAGIFAENFSHNEYQTVVKLIAQADEKSLQAYFADEVNLTALQEPNCKTVNQMLQQVTKMIDRDAVQIDITGATGTNDTEDAHEDLLYVYENIMGLTADQAAYQVLYETSLNNIMEQMQASGYSFSTIEKMLQGEEAFDDTMYAVIEDDVNMLKTLPARNEIFSEEEEAKMVEIEQILLSLYEQHNIDLKNIENVSEAELASIEKKFMEKISPLSLKN